MLRAADSLRLLTLLRRPSMWAGRLRPKAFVRDRELCRRSDGLALRLEMALALVLAWLAFEETTTALHQSELSDTTIRSGLVVFNIIGGNACPPKTLSSRRSQPPNLACFSAHFFSACFLISVSPLQAYQG